MKRITSGMMMYLICMPLLANDSVGQATYELSCKNCHAPNLATAIKAPALGDVKEWDKRFARAEAEAKKNPERFKSAMDYLVYHVKIGKGLMHHGGLCHESTANKQACSDEAFIAAIQYMREQHRL